MTIPKSRKNRKSSSRAQPKRAAVSALRAVPPAAPAVSAAVSAAVVPAVSAATDEHASIGICVHLEPGLEIKDAEGVHRLLLAALGDGRAVTVDVGRVQAVDTAGAQLLLAFQGEASRRGVTVDFHGESAPLTHTLAVLGLRDKFLFAVPHG
ncbi:MAG TPA: STAS domain-containing protein [Steroidobacteraceae bacterium]|nr:STAS domain-containing protein [Steroidobacteraceae bacterium]